ncbi:methylated-DNA--[protein]-cysteine S-methyltransferase [Pseudoruegeria sp. HB172150]|uniref:methylated-DNA--[protein]-cysteine S-methyltransferase n=1 Tax=Pseudoruegeria sp. HB172150 TaxID=2721164 RepID=UPI00352D9570
MRAGLDTPVGPFWIETEDGAVTQAGWGRVEAGTGSDPVAAQALDELIEYFEGGRTGFSVPLRSKLTGLNARAQEAMLAIPFGETRTYGDLAKLLDAPAQAIGQACGANTIPILIPCHRVLGSNGLGGYSGRGGIETKVALLKLEGAASLLI